MTVVFLTSVTNAKQATKRKFHDWFPRKTLLATIFYDVKAERKYSFSVLAHWMRKVRCPCNISWMFLFRKTEKLW